MKSYKGFTGVKGSLAVLPTLEERSVDTEPDSSGGEGSSESCSSSADEQRVNAANCYPADLLGMSWGSYLNSGPPTRTGLEGSEGRECHGNNEPHPPLQQPHQQPHPLPHPLLQHLEGLMATLTRSKQELAECGLDVSPLTTLCNATLSSHSDLKQVVQTLIRGGTNCNDVVITSDLMHNLVEYMREVLQGLVSQGKKLNVQAAFLQQAAKQLKRQQQECLKEQAKCQEVIDSDRTRLNHDRRELDKRRQSILKAEEELKRVLVEAEENLNHHGGRKKKGRMDSPHSVAQGRTQLAALVQTQKQQSRLDKILTQQQRDIRYLQQAHSFTKSELLAVQDHATKLQRKLAKQINEESALAPNFGVTRESLAYPSMALDNEKRKSYHGVSKAQVKATLKGIAAAQKTLNTEIERMQRQFSEQHSTEQRVSRQLEESGQRLHEMGSRVKEHTSHIRGVGCRISRKTTVHQQEHVTLPAIPQAPDKPQRKFQSESISLPKMDQPSCPRMARKSKRLPNYQFSKAELFTLAKFDNYETADQVMQWLRSQGKLK